MISILHKKTAVSVFSLLLGISYLALCAASADNVSQDSPGGTLIHPRYFHTATRLADGRVMLVGGLLPDVTASCEIYNPATNSWATTGSLHVGRYGHRSVLLPDGRVLIMGGEEFGANTVNTAEIYDPSTGAWSITGSMLSARAAFDAVLLSNGKLLVAGGAIEATELSGCELYDPSTGTWSATGNLLHSRHGHNLTALADGRILLAGGFAQGLGAIGPSEVYDPSTGIWSASGSLSRPRTDNIQVRLADGRVLVAGGFIWRAISEAKLTGSTEIYDPSTGVWTPTGALRIVRSSFTGNLLDSGRVFAIGGSNTTSLALDSIEEFDPALGVWRVSPAILESGRRLHTTTTLKDGSLIVAGGLGTGFVAVPTAELFVRPR